jgi:hypothetical protein
MTDSDLRQLTQLVYPFPARVVKSNPSGGGTYVAHPVVEQRLLDVLGYPPDTRLVQIVRGRPPTPTGRLRGPRRALLTCLTPSWPWS